MLLDIRKIFASYDKPAIQEHQIDLSSEGFIGYAVQKPVELKLTFSLDGSVLELRANMHFTVDTECARCLDEIHREFDIEKIYFIREDEWQNDELEIELTRNGQLDLSEFVYSEIVLEVPSVIVCSETCEGLCPVCGRRKPCSCRHETSDGTDPRLSILKQLLN